MTFMFYFIVSMTTILLFNEEEIGKKSMFSILAIELPVEKEVVSHTVTALKTGRNFDLDGIRAFAKR